jgi:hypothetical protein
MSRNYLLGIGAVIIILVAIGGVVVYGNGHKKVSLENKAMCAKYTDQIKKELASHSGIDREGNSSNEELVKYFYSPIENSCLYSKEWTDGLSRWDNNHNYVSN